MRQEDLGVFDRCQERIAFEPLLVVVDVLAISSGAPFSSMISWSLVARVTKAMN